MKVIQGQFQLPNGNPAANATLKLQLSQDATTGGQQVAPVVYYITLDTNGNIPSGTEISANDELSPNTFYIVTLTMPSLGRIYGPENFPIVGTSPINLNTIIPAQLPLPASLADLTFTANTDFSAISSGDNIQATMTVDTGASLSYVNSGVLNANELGGINVVGNSPTHAGMVLISQPGNTTAVWADPQVQGLYAAGSSIASPPAYTAPTTIQPVLIGAANPSGALENLNIDNAGNLFINVANTVAVSGTFWPTTQPVSGTVAISNFPATQVVSGTISVSNFPSTQAVTQSGSWTVGVTGSVAVTGTFWQATQPVSGTVSVSSVSGSVTVTNAGSFAVQDSTAEGYLATLAGTVSSGKVTVAQATAANLNATVVQGTASSLNATVVGTGTFAVQSNAATPKGFHISSNAVQAIKSSAGNLYSYFLDNTANSSATYFQFFNVASSSVTLGSTSPLFVIPVPAGLAANLNMNWAFSTAMSFAATTTYNGSTAPASAVDCTLAWV